MRILSTILLFFLVANLGVAQNYKFGKVSKEEVEETQDPSYPEVNAAVFYRDFKVYFEYRQNEGFIQNIEVHERVKIYNKEGFDWATKEIKLYDADNGLKEKIKNIKGVTYNLNGKKVVETKLEKDNIFEEKNNEFWETTKFTLPNVNAGSVIEYQYTIETPRFTIEDIDLQYIIPIRKYNLEVRTPEYFNFNKHFNPKAKFFPELLESRESKSEVITTKNRTKTSSGFHSVKTNFETSSLDYMENIVSADLNNVPPLKNENYVRNLDGYRAKLFFEYAFFRGPNGEIKSYSTTWDKVTKHIYDSQYFGAELEKTAYFKEAIDLLIANAESESEKAVLIYNYVKSHVKWNDYNGYTVHNGVKKAFKERTGNVADINLMLTAMLRYAGLNANPVLISTVKNGIPLYPTTEGFNYVIAAIEVPGDLILLDATDEYAAPNVLPNRAVNWQGRIIRESGSSTWVALNPKKESKESISLNVKINNDLTVDGKVRAQLSDYFAKYHRDKFNKVSMDQKLSYLEKDNFGIEASNYEGKGELQLSEPMVYSFDYSLSDAIEEIGGKLYFSPLLFMMPDENPFKQETREYPVDYVFPFVDQYMVNIMLPEGYVVESLPESSKIQFNGNECVFTFLGGQNGKMLQFSMSYKMNKPLILPGEYEQFRDFYSKMIAKKQEQIVLKQES